MVPRRKDLVGSCWCPHFSVELSLGRGRGGADKSVSPQRAKERTAREADFNSEGVIPPARLY